jgi:hypothetical protein
VRRVVRKQGIKRGCRPIHKAALLGLSALRAKRKRSEKS